MKNSHHKAIWAAAWVIVVFAYFWVMSFVYEKDKNFLLFVFLAIAGNLAYDGLKAVLSYDASYTRDAKIITGYVFGFLGAMTSSLLCLFVGAQLATYHWLSDSSAQVVAGVGFLLCTASGMWLIADAERKFRNTARQS